MHLPNLKTWILWRGITSIIISMILPTSHLGDNLSSHRWRIPSVPKVWTYKRSDQGRVTYNPFKRSNKTWKNSSQITILLRAIIPVRSTGVTTLILGSTLRSSLKIASTSLSSATSTQPKLRLIKHFLKSCLAWKWRKRLRSRSNFSWKL